MSLKKSYEEPYFNMARVYFARQEYDLALQYADKAITAYEETEDDEWEAANYLRSLILEQLGVKELENGDQSSNEDDSDDAEKMEDPAAKPTFAQLHPSVLGQ
jgi:tetratricopeptide (TPR) repeat protein